MSCISSVTRPLVASVVLYRRVDGANRPITRVLSAAEMKYSQFKRVTLALVFGVTKFREYLLGQRFTLLTDHKPLVWLFQFDKVMPVMAAARIQSRALFLSA